MSNVENQHFVPCGHLKRFAENEMIFVTRREDLKEFQKNIQEVARLKYGYDQDPDSKTSFEEYLRIFESYLTPIIDRLLDGNSGESDFELFLYVGMLDDRSTNVMSAIEDMRLPMDSREIHLKYFDSEKWNVRGKQFEYYSGGRAILGGCEELITSDNPVNVIDTKILFKGVSEGEILPGSEDGDRNVVICPLSSRCCAVFMEKNSNNRYVETFMRLMTNDPGRFVSVVNFHMASNAIEEIYCEKSGKGVYYLTDRSFEHPNQNQRAENLSKRRKLGKKVHK